MSNKNFSLAAGSLMAGLAVILGAFGSHMLEPQLLDSGYLDTYHTAVRYQFYHAFGIIVCALIQIKYSDKIIRFIAMGFLAGIILFSGSLYLIATTGIKSFGAITPLGGIAFIASWLTLAYWGFKRF